MPVEVVVPKLTCLRCGHQWYPRKPGRPTTCAGCRSPYWDVPRRNETGQPTRIKPDSDSG